MRTRRRLARLSPRRLSLTQQVALLSLLPIVALGFALTRVLQDQVVSRTLADADQSAGLIARIGVQPNITPEGLRNGLSAAEVHALDQQLSGRSVTRDLARIKIWNSHDRVVYSDDHALIGRTLVPSDDLEHALAGDPDDAEVVTPSRYSETASEVGLGQLVEVYVPLHFARSGPPVGAFEIYLSYRPIAAALSHDKKTIALIVAIGLAILWAILYRIVARASRRLARQSEENYHLARYDELTGLPNRTLFIERLTDAARRQQSREGEVAVLLVDLSASSRSTTRWAARPAIGCCARSAGACCRRSTAPRWWPVRGLMSTRFSPRTSPARQERWRSPRASRKASSSRSQPTLSSCTSRRISASP